MKTCLFFVLIFTCIISYAQINLVHNPSFEEYSECPNENFDFIHLAKGWSSYRATPDYFNRCSVDTLSSVPCNVAGCREPATGDGYIGLIGFNRTNNYREIVGSKLITPLTVGQTYYVSFKANAVYGGYWGFQWFSNKLGIRFSMVEYEYDYDRPDLSVPIDNFAHVYTDEIITDTANWTVVSGSFVADLPYQYIMLGNFFDNENTDTLTNGIWNYASYYFIDDVCVTTEPTGCNFISGIKEFSKNDILIYPNPANNILYVNLPLASKVTEIAIYNIMGEMINADISYNERTLSIDVNNFLSGMYFITLKEKSNIIYNSFFINH